MTPPPAVAEAGARLRRWLLDEALPLWWERGADPGGGYHDRINLDGTVAEGPKRLRVQARQAHVYAQARTFGWSGPAKTASRHGLSQALTYRCADGLYRTSERAEAPLDGMGLIYDQAFVLLALASERAAFGDWGQEDVALRLAWRLQDFAEPAGGYAEAPGLATPLFANANMHLFESFQAWMRSGADDNWAVFAERQAKLALDRLIDLATGALAERFAAGWRVAEAQEQRVVWPGHLYEWAFLLLDWPGADAAAKAAALRLIEVAEARGVASGIAIFALGADLQPLDRGARLWSQTERLRACARAGLWDAALEACAALEKFLDVPTPGLWRDWMDEAGAFRDEPAPASSLYHIVGAIAELERLTSASS